MVWGWLRRGLTRGDVSAPNSASVSEIEGRLIELLDQLPARLEAASASPASAPAAPSPSPDSSDQLRKDLHALAQRLSRVVASLKSQGLVVPGRWPSEESSADAADSLSEISEQSERPRVSAGRPYRPANGS